MNRTTPMKRSPFTAKPKSPKTDRAPRVTHKRGTSSIWRSDAYLALVRSLPCVCCGVAGYTQAAHSNQLRFAKGRSIKASDASAMALCGPRPQWSGCHAQHDQGGKLNKDEWKYFESENICRTIFSLHNLGKLAGENIPLVIGPDRFDEWSLRLVAIIERGELQIA